MDTFIELIGKCVPFPAWLEKLGLSKELSAALSFLIILGIVWAIGKIAVSLYHRLEHLKAAKDLKPQFDYNAIREKTRIYIPTRYQNATPTKQEEPGFTHQYVASNPLIPFFIDHAFNEKADGGERFYLILADSGMGKTTFMINLFLAYHSFFNRKQPYKMRLFRFSDKDTMKEVKAIKKEEAINTILLLDALDEDPYIVSNDPNITDGQAFDRRVREIIESTRHFCEVVMTCRTQYFPGQEDRPYELEIKRPDEKGHYLLNKLYLSPFKTNEVDLYLKKKYGRLPFVNRDKKRRAAQLVNQSRHLIMRPMMLSYIDDLLKDANKKFETDYEIYETLIEKWLDREAEKRKKRHDQATFKYKLQKLSQQTAIAIWKSWQENKRMYLTKLEAVAIATENEIDLRPEEVTGQSLLTCDGAGNWKFAHKSIMEFFLTKAMLDDPDFHDKFDFVGMDMSKRFLYNILKVPENFEWVIGGTFRMGDKMEGTVHNVRLSNFCIGKFPVTQGEYTRNTGKKNPSHFKNNDKNPVENISWSDAVNYCNLLNKKMGFPAVYDGAGNLLDATGKATTDITRVKGYRLPTEAEWEFAARGGLYSRGFEYSGSNDIKEVAWYRENSDSKIHPVGTLKPNELGLHDMSGNVWEWCHDWYDAKYYDECKAKGTVNDPTGPATGSDRVLRGGSWLGDAVHCRSADRRAVSPTEHGHVLGFRLVFVPQ